VISDAQIANIARIVPPGVATFLLTSETSADAIAMHQQKVRTNTVQIVDRVAPEVYAQLRRQLPGIKLVQVIHVIGPKSLTEALTLAPLVDALLLDSGNPTAAVKELDGTGRGHDWSVSR